MRTNILKISVIKREAKLTLKCSADINFHTAFFPISHKRSCVSVFALKGSPISEFSLYFRKNDS